VFARPKARGEYHQAGELHTTEVEQVKQKTLSKMANGLPLYGGKQTRRRWIVNSRC
jgi:hypothetical protein